MEEGAGSRISAAGLDLGFFCFQASFGVFPCLPSKFLLCLKDLDGVM